MKPEERELVLRASTEELNPEETRRLEDLLAQDPEAAAELERLRQLGGLVRGARQESFAPFFSSRVMQRIRTGREAPAASVADSLAWLFSRAAPAALAVAMALFAFNVIGGGEDSGSALESALGLPEVTLDAAYAFDPTFYSGEAEESTTGRQQ